MLLATKAITKAAIIFQILIAKFYLGLLLSRFTVYLAVCVFVCVSICHICVGAHQILKRVSNPLDLELYDVISCGCGAGN